MNKKYKLKGHESFVLRDGWLTKGIQAVLKDPKLFTVNAGADALGVGTNMAKSIRYWLNAGMLITDSPAKGVFLSVIGKIIHDNDLYCEDVFTLWIIHSIIARNFEKATSWNLFFNAMNVTSGFTRDEMVGMMKELIIEHTGEQEPSERSIRDDCSAILSMYSPSVSTEDPEEKRNSPFEVLGLISRSGNRFTKKRPMIDKIDPLVFMFLIVDSLNENGSLQIDQITDGYNMPGKILNMNRIAVNSFLDILHNRKYITVNRTAGLDIVYPNSCQTMSSTDVLQEYYGRSSRS